MIASPDPMCIMGQLSCTATSHTSGLNHFVFRQEEHKHESTHDNYFGNGCMYNNAYYHLLV